MNARGFLRGLPLWLAFACAPKAAPGDKSESVDDAGRAATAAAPELPRIQPDRYVIVVEAPDMDPAEVETRVSAVIEAEMSSVPGVAQVSSTSARAMATVTVTAATGASDLSVSLRDALGRAQARLPESVELPLLQAQRSRGRLRVVSIKHGGGLKPMAVAASLRTVPGVQSVEVCGEARPTLAVVVDPQRLATQGLPMSVVHAQLQAALGLPEASKARLSRLVLRDEPELQLRDVATIRTLGQGDCQCLAKNGSATCLSVGVDLSRLDGDAYTAALGTPAQEILGIDAGISLRVYGRGPPARSGALWDFSGVLGKTDGPAALPLPDAMLEEPKRGFITLHFETLEVELMRAWLRETVAPMPSMLASVEQLAGHQAQWVGVSGDEPAALAQARERIERALLNNDHPAWRFRPTLLLRPQLDVRPDPERLAALGIPLSEFMAATRQATGPTLIHGRGFLGEDQGFDVTVSLRGVSARRPESLRDIPLRTAEGKTVPLGAVAVIEVRDSPFAFEHIDGQRATSLEVWVADAQVAAWRETTWPKIRAGIELPAGVRWIEPPPAI